MCVLVYYQFIHSDWNWVVGFRRINKYINWIKEHIFKNRCAEQKCDKNQKQNNEHFCNAQKQCKYCSDAAKGQLISECLFYVLNFPKNQQKI